MAIPGVRKTKWYWLDWVLQAALVAAALIPLSIGAWEELDKRTAKHNAWWYVTAIAIVFLIGIVKVAIEFDRTKVRNRKDSPQDLVGCLTVLYEMVRCKCSTKDIDTLRVTIHRVDREHLEQCVAYIGCDCGGEGRQFSKRSGIIGRALISKQPLVGTRTNADSDKYHKELAEVWHMPAEEATKVRQDRWTWMAVPLRSANGGEPPAVVYLDSSEPDFFTKEIQELVLWGCTGVAAFIRERYPDQES